MRIFNVMFRVLKMCFFRDINGLFVLMLLQIPTEMFIYPDAPIALLEVIKGFML